LRYITRPARIWKLQWKENRNIEKSQFNTMVTEGKIQSPRSRKFEETAVGWDRRIEFYGFMSNKKLCENIEEIWEHYFPGNSRSMVIFSANNDFFRTLEDNDRYNLNKSHTLILGVFAPDVIREQRVLQRSPDMKSKNPKEFDYRMADKSENIVAHCHILIDNYDITIEKLQLDSHEFINNILDYKKTP